MFEISILTLLKVTFNVQILLLVLEKLSQMGHTHTHDLFAFIFHSFYLLPYLLLNHRL